MLITSAKRVISGRVPTIIRSFIFDFDKNALIFSLLDFFDSCRNRLDIFDNLIALIILDIFDVAFLMIEHRIRNTRKLINTTIVGKDTRNADTISNLNRGIGTECKDIKTIGLAVDCILDVESVTGFSGNDTFESPSGKFIAIGGIFDFLSLEISL